MWPFKRAKEAPSGQAPSSRTRKVLDLGDDPLRHAGGGIIRKGDPMLNLLKKGEPFVADRRDDGLWDVD